MTFRDPTYLLALLVVPLAVLAMLAAGRRRRRYAVRFTAMPALAAVARSGPSWRRWLAATLMLAAIAGMVVALARPERSVAVAIERASVMLVMDTSNSMIATDVDPSRLEAAQRAGLAFLDKVPERLQVGAIAYATGPYSVQQPTTDHDEARQVLENLAPNGATATGDALQAAIDSLRQVRGRDGRQAPSAIVLLSDGRTTSGRDPIPVAREAARLRIPIYTVALGTPSGSIPGPGGVGRIPTPPDPETLREIASITKGRAFNTAASGELSRVYEALGSRLGSRQEKREMTAGFAAAGAVLLALALAASLRWAGRLP